MRDRIPPVCAQALVGKAQRARVTSEWTLFSISVACFLFALRSEVATLARFGIYAVVAGRHLCRGVESRQY